MKTRVSLLVFILAVILSFISFAQVQNIAHRGCSSLAPENTYSAWIKAIDAGADYFELDIQLSSDDSMMIIHDATLHRTTNGTGLVSSFTYEQLRLLDAGSWFSSEYTGEKIPTFAEALQLAKNNVNIDVVAEIKTSDATIVQKVVKMIQDFGMEDRVIVSSFSFPQIAECRSLDASIDIQLFGTITNALIDQVAGINGEWVGSGGTITQELIYYAHSQNILFNAWTINTGSQMSSLITLGVDGITTNYPQVLTAITDDITSPTDVIINSAVTTRETDITLDWQPSVDPESGIAGYKIYRDVVPEPTILYITVGNITNFVDHTLIENQTFYYRIKALNGAGLISTDYSNEVSATTIKSPRKKGQNKETSTEIVEMYNNDKGAANFLGTVKLNEGIKVVPTEFAIHQNYPNPFNPTTQINYSLPKSSFVSLKVYDVLGREVATLVNQTQNNGSYNISFNANNLASGVYFYKLEAGDFISIKKMLLVK